MTETKTNIAKNVNAGFGEKLLIFTDKHFQLKSTLKWNSNSPNPERDPERLTRLFKQRIRFENNLMVYNQTEGNAVHFYSYLIYSRSSSILFSLFPALTIYPGRIEVSRVNGKTQVCLSWAYGRVLYFSLLPLTLAIAHWPLGIILGLLYFLHLAYSVNAIHGGLKDEMKKVVQAISVFNKRKK